MINTVCVQYSMSIEMVLHREKCGSNYLQVNAGLWRTNMYVSDFIIDAYS